MVTNGHVIYIMEQAFEALECIPPTGSEPVRAPVQQLVGGEGRKWGEGGSRVSLLIDHKGSLEQGVTEEAP
jgi:hypothetical protein